MSKIADINDIIENVRIVQKENPVDMGPYHHYAIFFIKGYIKWCEKVGFNIKFNNW